MSEFDPNKSPLVLKRLREANEEFLERQAQLEKEAINPEGRGADANLPDNQQNKPAAAGAHFSEKLYYFPPEFNALRQELEDHFRNFFHSVNPEMGTSPAYAMVFDAPKFVGMCNGALDMDVAFDSENVAGTCKRFLNGFRKLRGLSPLE